MAEEGVEPHMSVASLLLQGGPKSRPEAEQMKLQAARMLGLGRIPSNVELIQAASPPIRQQLSALIRKKLTKTISGVSVITVVAPVYHCPHGRCVYCPGGAADGTPQSYTGNEAVVKRASAVGFDPYRQVRDAVKRLRDMGHSVDKVELIIIGGTFNAMPQSFQEFFIRRCLDALTEYDSQGLDEALMAAESACTRVSGITVETKPDWGKRVQANSLLEMGVTKVELGVQALDDSIYRVTNRGHTLADVVEATADLKDLALKVGYHFMPNLPGSTIEKDEEMFRRMFEDERFRPDYLKIYPTLVLPRTALHAWYVQGRYQPYSDEEIVELLTRCLSHVPPYVRVQRIQREIPLESTVAGNKLSNLRQVVEREMMSRGLPCRCIRCRELGRKISANQSDLGFVDAQLNRLDYSASGGVECFISFDLPASDALLGFIRLRIPERSLRPELRKAALVRELHVYGEMTPINQTPSSRSAQHRSFGKRLLAEAEKVALEEFGARKIVVISGVGVRGYYYRQGYTRDGPYVSKPLR